MTTAIADGDTRRLDPRYVDLQRQIGWLTVAGLVLVAAFVALACVAFAWLGVRTLAWAALAAAAFLAWLAWFLQRWPAVEYRFASYRVDLAGLEITRGVYWRRVVSVPRSRIQHTDVSQGPLERRHGLGTLVIHTAGNEFASVELPGLPYETALAIRDHLLPRDLVDAV